jgi:hypothetical protein
MLIKEFSITNITLLVTAGLTLRRVNFFVYTRVISKAVLKNTNQSQISPKQTTKTRITLFIISILFPMPLIYLLGNA